MQADSTPDPEPCKSNHIAYNQFIYLHEKKPERLYENFISSLNHIILKSEETTLQGLMK